MGGLKLMSSSAPPFSRAGWFGSFRIGGSHSVWIGDKEKHVVGHKRRRGRDGELMDVLCDC